MYKFFFKCFEQNKTDDRNRDIYFVWPGWHDVSKNLLTLNATPLLTINAKY